MPIENILIDLDGTIIDSSEGIWKAFKKSCKLISKEIPSKEKFIAGIGPPISIMAKNNIEGIRDDELEVVSKTFRYEYDNKYFMQFKEYDKIEQTLINLQNGGAKIISIVTNKPTDISKKIINTLRLDKYFKDIIGSDYKFCHQTRNQKQSKTENIKNLMMTRGMAPDSTVYVGDTKMDYISAESCKIKFIAATYGYHQWADNEIKECTAINRFSELEFTLAEINKQG